MAKYSEKAQKAVEKAMHKMKEGKLKNGKSEKKVRLAKQAIAIGLSEARKKGLKVPPAPQKSTPKAKPKTIPKAKKTPKKGYSRPKPSASKTAATK